MNYTDADTLTTALEGAAGILPWRLRAEVVADLVDHEPPDDLADLACDVWRRAVGLSRLPQVTRAALRSAVADWQHSRQAIDHGRQLVMLGGAA